MRHLRAYWLGIKDGFEQPYQLTMGMTWADDSLRNEIYDRGVNLGQRIGALATALRKAGKAFSDHIRPQSLE